MTVEDREVTGEVHSNVPPSRELCYVLVGGLLLIKRSDLIMCG